MYILCIYTFIIFLFGYLYIYFFQAFSLDAKVDSMAVQEKDYGSEMGLLRRAPGSTTAHPLEASERSYHKKRDETRMACATKAFGLGFALHQRHERAAVSFVLMGVFPNCLSDCQSLFTSN